MNDAPINRIHSQRATAQHKIQWCMSTKRAHFTTAKCIYNEVWAVAWSKMRKGMGLEAQETDFEAFNWMRISDQNIVSEENMKTEKIRTKIREVIHGRCEIRAWTWNMAPTGLIGMRESIWTIWTFEWELSALFRSRFPDRYEQKCSSIYFSLNQSIAEDVPSKISAGFFLRSKSVLLFWTVLICICMQTPFFSHDNKH